MKRAVALILTLVLTLGLISCAKMSDEEILTEYKALYAKAQEVNKIIYGSGLPYDGEIDLSGVSEPHYVAVSESCPYKTLEDVKNAVLSVYTEDYYNDVFKRVLFDGYEDDYAKIIPRYKEVDGVLMTDVTYEPFASIENGRCDLDLAVVVKNTRGGAEVSAPFYISDVRQKNDKVTTIIHTADGIRFDSIA